MGAPPTPSPSPQDLRAELATLLALRAGLDPRAAAERAAHARDDASFAESVVQALVQGGAWIVEDPGARRVRLEELDEALPPLREVEDALDRRRARPLEPEERVRLARLYALAERDEKAASCYRELLAEGEALPLAMAIEVAEAAAGAGAHALALAGIDRVAETVLTRDPNAEAPGQTDILREDPLGAGALLERARDIALQIDHAPRAVALARAATALYERLGRRQEARESLAGQARSLLAAGRGKRARQVAERWRELAGEDEAVMSQARALGWLAAELDADGNLRAAADLHREAVELLSDAGDPHGAMHHARRRAALLERAGSPVDARATLLRARELAAGAGDEAARLELCLDCARLDLLLGDLASAIATATDVRAAHQAGGDDAAAASAATLLADALLLAGDASGARAALLEAAPALLRADAPAAEGRCARVRAELDAVDGRLPEAGLLLLDAARAFLQAGLTPDAVQCVLRRAELLAGAGDKEAARQELKRALDLTGTLEPRLELRMELLRAGLAPPDESELLLDEVAERAPSEGDPWVKAAVAAARARVLRAAGDAATADALLEATRADLSKIRDALPEPLRAGFARSPWMRMLSAR